MGRCCSSFNDATYSEAETTPMRHLHSSQVQIKSSIKCRKTAISGVFSDKIGPSRETRTPGILLPNGSYGHFSRSSPLVFRPAVRCNAVVARCGEFLSGTARKCVLRCPVSGCGCDCGSAFWVLLNVLRGYRKLIRL